MSPKEFVKFCRKPTRSAFERAPRLTVSPEVMSFIERTAAQSRTAETGGILMGFNDGVDIRVVRATDAGPGARRSSCGFLRDTKYCQEILDDEFTKSGADYVGEWHTHVIDLPRPSRGDLTTLASIVLDPEYNFSSFAMMLGVVTEGETKVLAYMVVSDSSVGHHNKKVVTVMEVIPDLKEVEKSPLRVQEDRG